MLTELHKNKELKKQMVHAAESVLDPSNLTSRVTVLVATLRKLKVSSKARLAELGKLQWLLDCLLPWYSKQGQAILTKTWGKITANSQ